MNRGFRTWVPIAVTVMVLAAVAAAAQPPGPAAGGGGGKGARAGRVYDPATVETVSGEVVRIDRVPGRGGRSHGVHLLLKTATEEIAVRLGPAWYIDKQPMRLAPKDRVEVQGSRVMLGGTAAIIAARVSKGSEVMQLRADNGVPAWRGQKRPTP